MHASMAVTAAILIGFILDLIFADPIAIPHPVVIIGKLISVLDKKLRKGDGEKDIKRGAVLTALVIIITFIVTAGISVIAWMIHPVCFFILQCWWCWQALAQKGLAAEGKNIYRAVKYGSLEEQQKAVGRVCGRDTGGLDSLGCIKAAIETIAENFSDGVLAPMLYMAIGGAPLALTYKAVNTMDSMLGYKNEKYLYFGRVAAKTDDVFNYIPARLAAFMWMIGAGITGNDMRNSFRMWKRDRKNHASPNSAQTESACAGALNIQLAGPAYYFGEFYDKPTIGDAGRAIEPEDIIKTNKMMYAAGIITLILLVGIRLGIMSAMGVI